MKLPLSAIRVALVAISALFVARALYLYATTPGAGWAMWTAFMAGWFVSLPWYRGTSRPTRHTVEGGEETASYRVQAAEGDGNILSAGDIVNGVPTNNHQSWLAAEVDGLHYDARSDAKVSVGRRRGGGIILETRGVKFQVWR